MSKLNILDTSGFYAGDYVEGKTPDNWTSQLVQDGMYKAQYQGGTRNADTGEWTGGKWVETGSKPADEKAQALRAAFVAERDKQMAKLTVTVDGMVFDADEKSQARMHRAQAVMSDVETVLWVLNNNTSVLVTKKQLMKALDLASRAQAALWVMPKDFSL